jgi:30S ribosomal protein S31
MGRGDSRTKRGKIFKSSYGNVRKHRVGTSPKTASKPATSATPKKTSGTKKTK